MFEIKFGDVSVGEFPTEAEAMAERDKRIAAAPKGAQSLLHRSLLVINKSAPVPAVKTAPYVPSVGDTVVSKTGPYPNRPARIVQTWEHSARVQFLHDQLIEAVLDLSTIERAK